MNDCRFKPEKLPLPNDDDDIKLGEFFACNYDDKMFSQNFCSCEQDRFEIL